MTTATKRQPKTIAGDNTPPEITAAIAKQEAAALAKRNKYLAAYRDYIRKAAAGEPIGPSDGDAAIVAAAELGIRASRIGQDVAFMRRHLANEKRRVDHLAGGEARKQRMADIRAEIPIHERCIRELKAEAHRIGADQTLTVCENEKRDLLAEAPHLFTGGIEQMNDQELAAMRRP